MAIAFDNSTAGGNEVYSFSHTTSGSNRILFVSLLGGLTDLVTSVTYGGTGMTKIYGLIPFGDRYVYLYYLIAPASGLNTVVINGLSPDVCRAIATSYTGAKQSGVPDAQNTGGSALATATSVSVTTIADNCWTVAYVRDNQGGTNCTAGANTTIRKSADQSYFFDSNSAKTPAGAVTLNFNHSAAARVDILSVSFAPFIASTFVARVMVV